jgi:hypothetical protein
VKAQGLTDGACLVIVVDDQLPLRLLLFANGTCAALTLIHGVVVGERNAIAYSQARVVDALWIFLAIFMTRS